MARMNGKLSKVVVAAKYRTSVHDHRTTCKELRRHRDIHNDRPAADRVYSRALRSTFDDVRLCCPADPLFGFPQDFQYMDAN